jgi:HSP20 family protein
MDVADVFTDRLGELPFFPDRGSRLGSAQMWHPSVDMFEDDGNVYVKLDVPGMSKDNIDVSFDGHILSITGKREEQVERNDSCYWSRERYEGDFHRYVHIPADIASEESLKATYDNGVLTITLQKAERSQKKKVAIESGK